jgi:hypothetical protein
MTTETIKQLQAIGVDPSKAQQGVTFGASGIHYIVKEFFSETRGIKMFRVYANGKLTLKAQEQVCAIFA